MAEQGLPGPEDAYAGEAAPEAAKRSPLAYVAMGCVVLVLLGMIVCAGGMLLVQGTALRFQKEMHDPVLRERGVKEMLGCEALPAGYHAMGRFEVPMVLRAAMIADREFDPGSTGPPDRLFIYVSWSAKAEHTDEMDAFFRGESDDFSAVGKGLDMELEEPVIVNRGELEASGQKLRYVVQRGKFGSDRIEADKTGLVTTILVGCPDERTRVAFWVGPDPGGEKGDPRLRGSSADPTAILAFMNHFHLCN